MLNNENAVLAERQVGGKRGSGTKGEKKFDCVGQWFSKRGPSSGQKIGEDTKKEEKR